MLEALITRRYPGTDSPIIAIDIVDNEEMWCDPWFGVACADFGVGKLFDRTPRSEPWRI